MRYNGNEGVSLSDTGGMMKDAFLTLRLTRAQRDKLERLAKQTRRSVSDVLRLLIEAAYATGSPDLILDEDKLPWDNADVGAKEGG